MGNSRRKPRKRGGLCRKENSVNRSAREGVEGKGMRGGKEEQRVQRKMKRLMEEKGKGRG